MNPFILVGWVMFALCKYKQKEEGLSGVGVVEVRDKD